MSSGMFVTQDVQQPKDQEIKSLGDYIKIAEQKKGVPHKYLSKFNTMTTAN